MKQSDLTSANKFAKAMIEVLQQNDQLQHGYEQLIALKQVFVDNPDLMEILDNSQTSTKLKKDLLATLTKDDDKFINNFIATIDNYRRFPLITLIIDQFEELYNKDQQIVHADVISATELQADQKDKLADAFAKKVNAKQVVFNTIVDESLIGGVIMKSANVIIDGSVKTRMQKIKQLLLK